MKVAQLYCLLAVVLLASSAKAQPLGADLRPANVTGNATAPAPAPVEALPVPEPAVSAEPVPAPVESIIPAPAPVVVDEPAPEPLPAPIDAPAPVVDVPAPVIDAPAPVVDVPAPEPAPVTEPLPESPAGGQRNVTITLPPAVEDILTDGALSVVLSTWASLVIPALLLAIA
jgi:outer membrane biosynthesis protein TonB